MIYLDFPLGSNYGWGLCGKYLAQELASLSDISLVRREAELTGLDMLDAHFLKTRLIAPELLREMDEGRTPRVDAPVLQGSPYMFPSWTRQHWLLPRLKGRKTVSYMFFDENRFHPDYVNYMADNWDMVVAGSSWCEELLRQNGLQNTTTILQGVDPTLFNSLQADKELFKGKFVIFSGGKFEFRKGQDIVIRAYKILQDKYKDVMLVNAWHNHWIQSADTMQSSPFIQYERHTDNCPEMINHLLAKHGIDMSRVLTLPPYPNAMMAKVYRNTDIGLFTNRWEGGTNLVMMEYMACAKPVIAAYHTGHKDILHPNNALMITRMREKHIQMENTTFATWYECDLDETLTHLEWAYNNRDRIRWAGAHAARDMAKTTWKHAAERFYDVLKN